MMKCSVISILASALVVTGLSVAPVFAGGLLGDITDTITDTVSDTVDTVTDTVDSVTGGGGGGIVDVVTDTVSDITGGGGTGVIGDVVSINSTNNNAVINVDIGGGKNNVLSASVGKGTTPLAKLAVTSTGLLKNTVVTLDLAGLGLDLQIDLGILAPILGGPNNPGGPNTPGNPNNPNNPNNPGQPVLVGSLDGGGTFVINCTVNNTRQVLQVAANGKISAAEIKAWQRSANVQIVPIKLCPLAKKQVAAILGKSQKMNLLQRAVMGDSLIMASLSRTSYRPGDVVAVQRKGGQLVVYVY